jgi:hypothetical protein
MITSAVARKSVGPMPIFNGGFLNGFSARVRHSRVQQYHPKITKTIFV